MNKYFVLIWLIFLTIGCSSVNSPTQPDKSISENINNPLALGVSDFLADGTISSGVGVMGLFSLSLDPENVTAELTPIRSSAAMDVLEIVDITNFLRIMPCSDCAKLNSVSLDGDGNLVVQIGIRHPFPAGDPLKPITGQNRADLHVFNVEGTLISSAPSTGFPLSEASIAGFELVNADGYSSYLDTVIEDIFPTEATIHPYILHFDDYTTGNYSASNPMGFENVTDPGPSGNLVMPMGAGAYEYDFQNYVLKLDGAFDFIYAIGCSYGVSADTKSLRFSPTFRVPQHNKKAASEVSIEILENNLESGNAASTAKLAVSVLDINHGVVVGNALDEMLADSSVANISVEIPGITAVLVEDTAPVPVSGDGRDPLNPLTFEIAITNDGLASAGDYRGLVKVLDSYSTGLNTSLLLGGMDGIERVPPGINPLNGLFVIDEFATYATFEISVIEIPTSDPPVAVISSPCEDNFILLNSSLFFDGRLSTDDNPPIAGYAWDFDWDEDPANFDVESTLDHLNHQFTVTGIFTVGLRVEDSDGQFSYDTVVIMAVLEFAPPMWQMEHVVTSWSGVEASERNYYPSHQIVADCDGIVHIIYKFITNGGPPSGLYYVNFDGTVMSEPELIDSAATSICQPTLRLEYDDNLHLTWNVSGSIKYCTRTGGAWSVPEIILQNSDVPGYMLEGGGMAVNYLGEITVASTKIDSSYDWYIVEVHNDGSGWSTVQDVTPLYLRISSSSYMRSSVDINADPDGRFHMTYLSWPDATSAYNYDFYHVICENGSWGAPVKFNDDSGQNIALANYIAPDGDLFAVWQTSRFGTFNAMIQRYDYLTQAWGPSIRVTQNPLSDDYSFFPDIAVSTEGYIMYVWEYYDGSMRHVYYKSFAETDDATTILNSSEREFITGAWNRSDPNLFYEPNGRIHLVFEDDRSEPNNYNARDMYYAVWK